MYKKTITFDNRCYSVQQCLSKTKASKFTQNLFRKYSLSGVYSTVLFCYLLFDSTNSLILFNSPIQLNIVHRFIKTKKTFMRSLDNYGIRHKRVSYKPLRFGLYKLGTFISMVHILQHQSTEVQCLTLLSTGK